MPPRILFEPELTPLPPGLVAFLTVWFFFLGGCVGSFMNVVIYRLPLGRSVVSPGSRCPKCGHAIRGFDNLPVISWLILRGKCRDCGLPIPFRYPLVELIVGLLFMLLAVEVVQRHGPWWLLNIEPRDFLTAPWPKLMGAFVYYQLALCTLLCAAYIAWDGERAPPALFVPAILAGLLFPAYWNEVRPLDVSANYWLTTLWHGLAAGGIGLLTGLLLGGLYDLLRDLRNAAGEPRGRMMLAAGTLGLMLGWRVALIGVVAGSMLALVWPLLWGRTWRAACAGPLAGLAISAIALVLGGRLLFERWSHLLLSQWLLIACSAVLVAILSLLARQLGPDPEPLAATDDTTSLDMIYP